jgi:hypothetical protein
MPITIKLNLSKETMDNLKRLEEFGASKKVNDAAEAFSAAFRATYTYGAFAQFAYLIDEWGAKLAVVTGLEGEELMLLKSLCVEKGQQIGETTLQSASSAIDEAFGDVYNQYMRTGDLVGLRAIIARYKTTLTERQKQLADKPTGGE